ncbi:hypothetical protein [Nitratireductor mangrovi]|nr:hypothetical protein [Nitratireductor mangrovi]
MSKAINARWSIDCLDWKIDEEARGTALYRIETANMPLDFIVHSRKPQKEGRIGRIIGQTWDMMAALVEGPASEHDIAVTGEEIQKLYAGRATDKTLVWARSNRSGRAFDHTVEALAAGRQPSIDVLSDVCYLMRNTGLDGNGTFGTRSFRTLEKDHPLKRPLEAQMLCAYLMRVFSIDLVNHLARCQSPHSARLAPEIQRFLGVGNGSALGLNLFVNNHPKLVHNFLTAREKAIVGAKSLEVGRQDPSVAFLIGLVERAIKFRRQDRMTYERFAESSLVADDLEKVKGVLSYFYETGLVGGSESRFPLSEIADWSEREVHDEAHETLLGLMTELVPDLCDSLAEELAADEEFSTDPSMSLGHLRDLLHSEYAWAFDMDLESESSRRFVWYKSATAEEPRRGAIDEVGSVFNLGLDLPRLVTRLDQEIASRDPALSVARFLLTAPEFRYIVARIQSLSGYAYHSPHMNMMGEEFTPSDVTRFINICIHGLDKTRDYLNRSLRGVIYQGAPTVDDLRAGADPIWFYPAEPRV